MFALLLQVPEHLDKLQVSDLCGEISEAVERLIGRAIERYAATRNKSRSTIASVFHALCHFLCHWQEPPQGLPESIGGFHVSEVCGGVAKASHDTKQRP